MDINSLTNINITQSTYSMNKDETTTNAFQSALDNAMASQDTEEIKAACQEFEAYFLKMMLSEMRKTIDTSGSYVEKSNAENIFQDMLDDEITSSIATSSNGFGFADMMYKQLTKSMETAVDPATTDFTV